MTSDEERVTRHTAPPGGDAASPIDLAARLAFVREYLTRDVPIAADAHGSPWRRNGRRAGITRGAYWQPRSGSRAENADLDAVTLAAIFYDVAKFESTDEEHAARGAESASEYLAREGHPYAWIVRVCQVIRNHTSSDADVPLEDRILRDADLLDGVGAIGIVWTAMNTGIESPSYSEARARIAAYDRHAAEKTVQAMSTHTGRAIAKQRLAFVNSFIAQLDEELGERFSPQTLRARRAQARMRQEKTRRTPERTFSLRTLRLNPSSFSGVRKHHFMIKGHRKVRIPNPHGNQDIHISLVNEIGFSFDHFLTGL